MTTLTSIYMIEKLDRTYRRGRKAPSAATHTFEGVDGDEQTNSVTYWYRRLSSTDQETTS